MDMKKTAHSRPISLRLKGDGHSKVINNDNFKIQALCIGFRHTLNIVCLGRFFTTGQREKE